MNFQIRRDDRGFKVGDHLRLREYDPELQQYTGRACERCITAIFGCDQLLAGEGKPVLAAGFVILGVAAVPLRAVDARGSAARSRERPHERLPARASRSPRSSPRRRTRASTSTRRSSTSSPTASSATT
jgi:hypothetical protein